MGASGARASGKAADDTVALIEAAGGTASSNYANVADHEQCGELIQQAVDTYGQLDILVNNAGIVRDSAIWNMPVDDWDAVMAVHVRGTWSTSHFAAKHFRDRAKQGDEVHGRIINTTSGAGLGGNFGQSGYATAKAAIVGLTLTLGPGALPLRRHRQLHRPGGSHPHHRDHAGFGRRVRARRGARGRVEPDGPEEQLAGGGLARERRGRLRDRPGDPRASTTSSSGWAGWYERKEISCDGKPWDAEKLGMLMATEIFETRHRGMEFRAL